MNIIFMNPGIDYMIQSILMFQSEEEAPFWSDSLYYFYPQLEKEKVQKMNIHDRRHYIEKEMQQIYIAAEVDIKEKQSSYQAHWEMNKKQIEQALSEAFEIDCTKLLNDMTCHISLNPVSPRFLEEKCFEVFYRNSERGAIGVVIHEIIHMVWFHVWKQVFHDSYEEYERPSMKWILSELVVESIMRDSRLSSINPYFERERGGCIYPYFFNMEVGGRLILEVIDEMYHTKDIKTFMKDSYAFCLLHKEEIRRHIEQEEHKND